jgi:serine protease Do
MSVEEARRIEVKVKNIGIRRWGLVIGVLALVVAAATAGSLVAEKDSSAAPVYTLATYNPPTDRVSLAAGFAPVVKRALPAVVNVSSSKVVKTADDMSPFSSDPFFRRFFGDQFGARIPKEQREHSLGSGVVISQDGYILTNNHVVEGATDVKVTFGDKREFVAKIVGRDPKTDVAVLKVDATHLPMLALGDSSRMQPGDIVLAIGNPFGLNQTVTMGIVSATGRGGLGIEDYEDFIQTDAAINPGNSGGALIDAQGNLIGINTAILSGGGGGNQGVGFAIPVNLARQVTDQILKNGRVVRGYLGVLIQPVTPAIQKAFGLKDTNGALIGDVTPNSPASRAGLAKGDVIESLDAQPVASSQGMRNEIAMMKPGSAVKLGIVRDGRAMEVPVTLGELPNKQEAEGEPGSSQNALQGVSVDELTTAVLRDLGLPPGTRGVVITDVSPSSPASDAGLRRGDVIQQVNRKPVASVSDFRRLLRESGSKTVLLLVNRGGQTMFVPVEPK